MSAFNGMDPRRRRDWRCRAQGALWGGLALAAGFLITAYTFGGQ